MSTQYPSEREEVGWMLKDIKEQQSSQPTGEPAPCVWRVGGALGDLRVAHDLYFYAERIVGWNFCPVCGSPLTVER